MIRFSVWRCKPFLIFLAALCLGTVARRAEAMGQVDTLPFSASTGFVRSVVIDSSKTFAYFGTNDVSTGVVRKVQLSSFAQVDSLSLLTSSGAVGFLLIDPANRYLYAASTATTGSITKIDIPTFSVIGSTVLPTSYTITSALIDAAGTFAYLGVRSDSNTVVKIQLSDMTRTGELLLAAAEGPLSAAVLDKSQEVGYFGTMTSPAQVIKVALPPGGAMSKTGTLELANGRNEIVSAVLSTTTDSAYFGSRSGTGAVFRVQLSTFQEQNPLALTSGVLGSAVIDEDSRYAYFGSSTAPSVVSRVRLNGFTQLGSTTLEAGMDFLTCMAIDTASGMIYAGMSTTPGSVVKVDVNDTRTGPPVIVTPPGSQVVSLGGTATFTVVAGGTEPFTYQWLKNGVAIPGATSAAYTTPALTLDDDSAVYQCTVTNALGSATSAGAVLTVMPVVKPYPNPWRADRHSPPMFFSGVPSNATLKIFTLSMHWVKSLQGTDPLQWDLTNDAGQPVASGFYFFVVTTGNDKQTVTGKIAVIR